MKRRYLIPLIILCIASFMWASHNDYEDALRDQAEYCKNVKDKVWPDYKGVYKESCDGAL